MKKIYWLLTLAIAPVMMPSLSFAQDHCNTCRTTPPDVEGSPAINVMAGGTTALKLKISTTLPGGALWVLFFGSPRVGENQEACYIKLKSSPEQIRELSCTNDHDAPRVLVVAGPSVTYTPNSSDTDSFNMPVYGDPTVEAIFCRLNSPTAGKLRNALNPLFDVTFPAVQQADLQLPNLGESGEKSGIQSI